MRRTPPDSRWPWTLARVLGGVSLGLVAFVVSLIAALLIAAGLNIGYEFHPRYLGLSLLVGAVALHTPFCLLLAGVGSNRLRLALGGALASSGTVTPAAGDPAATGTRLAGSAQGFPRCPASDGGPRWN